MSFRPSGARGGIPFNNLRLRPVGVNEYYIYIMASPSGTLYLGVTNNIRRRVYKHKKGLVSGFSQKYGCKGLVYFETFNDIKEAIAREKQLKSWNRKKKERLIRIVNPHWDDLSRGF